jgi:DNA-binding GntR family transcriptional regulator
MKLAVPSVNQAVYATIRGGILQGRYRSGQKLAIESLASELGVSSTPVRDALKRLEGDGLVTIRPRSGTQVTLPTLKDVEEVFALRSVLECFAAGSATGSISSQTLGAIEEALDRAENQDTDDSFIESDRLLHGAVIEAAGNQRLSQMIGTLRQQIELFRIVCVPDRDADMQYLRDHREILSALRARDSEKVEGLLREHIEHVRVQTVKLWPESPEE